MHSALTKAKGRDDWYDLQGLLESYEEDQIFAAKDRLIRAQKAVEPPRMVAELTFGFWTSLFNRSYDRSIAIPTLATAFPHMPTRIRNRRTVSIRLERLRKLRNRVFHHEPIWHWSDLGQQYEELHEVLDWISPHLAAVTKTFDRFSKVHNGGWTPFCEQFEEGVERMKEQYRRRPS